MEVKHFSNEKLSHMIFGKVWFKPAVKAVDGSKHTFAVYQIVFNLGALVRLQTRQVSSSLWPTILFTMVRKISPL